MQIKMVGNVYVNYFPTGCGKIFYSWRLINLGYVKGIYT